MAYLPVTTLVARLIGAVGFEPTTFRPPAGCATRLRHAPWPTDSRPERGRESFSRERVSGHDCPPDPRGKKPVLTVTDKASEAIDAIVASTGGPPDTAGVR